MSSLIERIKDERARSRQLRLLIVEEDTEIARFIQNHLAASYEVDLAISGTEALESYESRPPNLLLLASQLPDTDLLPLLQALRRANVDQLIPAIILGRPDDSRRLKLAALEMGVADYLITPFDMDELRYRVRNALPDLSQQADLVTGLPGWRAADDAMRVLLNQSSWHVLLIQIGHFESFRQRYGYIAGNEVLRAVARVLTEAAGAHGRFDDFIGHTSDDTFLLITSSNKVEAIIAHYRRAFRTYLNQCYVAADLDRGYLLLPDDQRAPLMRLATGVVSGEETRFADTLDIIVAAETRCQADQLI